MPLSIKMQNNNIENEKNKIHRLKELSLGKIISEVHNIIGVSKLPNPPIKTGMIKKNIIYNP
jgi:hypothetical protein